MRKALISLIFLLMPFFLLSQSFALSDTHFNINSCCVIRNVYFKLGSAELRPESFSALDSVAGFLNVYTSLRCEVGVHTDSRSCKGDEMRSYKIHEARARSTVEYLIRKGIDPERLVAKGYGCKKLLVQESEIRQLKSKDEIEAAHQKNRRVELKIIPATGTNFSLTDDQFSIGSCYSTSRIIFSLGKSDVLPDCYPLMDSIADFMTKFSYLKFEIGNHTDSRGSEIANLKLSEARAKAVRNYLVSKGIDEKRLTSQGYGESRLLIKDPAKDQSIIHGEIENIHTQNRRTEFIILAI